MVNRGQLGIQGENTLDLLFCSNPIPIMNQEKRRE